MIKPHAVRNFITHRDRRLVALMLGATLAVTGGLLGLLLALLGPVLTILLLVTLALAIWVVSSLEVALWGMVAIIALLPFATLPIKIVLTPTFLDMAMVAAIGIYLLQWMSGERRRLATTPVHGFVLAFIVLSMFSFVAGLRYAGLTPTVLRHFAELVLSMAFSLMLVDIIRSYEQLRRLALVLILTGAIAATLGITLWLLPDNLAASLLARLSIIGYPDGGVIQYIEANPDLPERAISTSVNPNSLGGFLVMIAALAAPQLITRYPITGKHWHAYPIMLVLVTCLVLTFSRGSMLAFGTALLFIAALRYRKLLVVPGAITVILLALPWSRTYLERFVEGFRFQGPDLATQMRFGEYRDALTLIARYPILGVGFSGAPDIDIYLGVANVYLTIGENMGVLGLGAFLILMATLFIYAWQARRTVDRTPGLQPIWLGLMAGLVGALAGGVLDHYFFNLEFHHAITLFWTFVGLTLAATRLALSAPSDHAP